METKFNSQICTTREQSERLLALGLKKETADVTIHHEYGITTIFGIDYSKYVNLHKEQGYTEEFFKNVFPAWSLHRMLSMLPILIDCKKELQSYSNQLYLDLYVNCISYMYTDYDYDDRIYISWGNDLFNAIVDAIEWLIKEGYFNKEYLV